MFKDIIRRQCDQLFTNFGAAHKFSSGLYNNVKDTVKDIPETDLLAARLILSPISSGRRPEPNPLLCSFLETLNRCKPRAFMVFLGLSSTRGNDFKRLEDEVSKAGYWSKWSVIDTAAVTGFPVRERKAIMFGALHEKQKAFDLQWYDTPKLSPPDLFLQIGQQIDPWYFRTRRAGDVPLQPGTRFYCWDGHDYAGTDRVGWNHRSIPLIWDGNALRKITHREIANLKGFPNNYFLPESGKSQLYQKLMYSGNVSVIQQAAQSIYRALESHAWPGLQMAQRFKDLFGRYIAADDRMALIPWDQPGPKPDFAVKYNETRLLIETKYYSTVTAPIYRLTEAAEGLQRISGDGIRVLAVANKVPAEIKTRLFKDSRIHVWDVANLLWLFDGDDEIKKEFIALLGYSAESITPIPPVSKIFPKVRSVPPKITPDWAGRLARIAAGEDDASDYERFCVDILKSVLDRYLILWREQERSNNGLYRFDLCCKIKLGVAQNVDFFNTIQQHFNTKYIVFEFKNYSEPITQKEIYTTEKYLYEKALRKVAIIIARKGADKHALQAARGCLRENGKLILCLSSEDLLEMARSDKNGDQEPVDILTSKLDDLLIDLDKQREQFKRLPVSDTSS